MATPPTSVVEKLAEFGQSHLLNWWDEISSDEQSTLLRQISEIDFPLVATLIEDHINNPAADDDGSGKEILPPSRLERYQADKALSGHGLAATRTGEELLRQGKVGAIVVAGGQGSRLGFDAPKGMFPIGPVTGHTLFQLFFEKLEALSRRYGVSVPYFIMTSEATDAATKEFLESNDYFGYSLHDVYIFKQGWLPAVGQDGKILLADKSNVAQSPDGHGGMLAALKRAGLIEIMKERGLEHVYYHQVDNPTALVCDPHFLGLHARYQSELSTKVVPKTHAGEKMGVVVDVDGDTQVIEYSDLSEDLQQATDENGNLVLWAGNTAIHTFSVNLLERLTDGGASLPFHRAHKKVPHVDAEGNVVEPDAPNAFKFEQFIFDAMPVAKNALVVETSRELEFNPVKNANGSDSPETARSAMLSIARSWCEEADIPVEAGARIEISPLYASSANELQEAFDSKTPLKGNVYLEPEDLTAV